MEIDFVVHQNSLVTVTLLANNKEYNFVLDTGSSFSLVDKSILKVWKGIKIQSTESTKIVGINGNALDYLAQITQQVTADKQTFNIDFYITDLSEMIRVIKEGVNVDIKGILGLDFFIRYALVLDFENNKIYTKK